MNPADLTSALKSKAEELGFPLAGVCPAVTPQGIHRFYEWLELGYAGQMHYLAARAEAYEHPKHVLPAVRSILMLAMPYRTEAPQIAAAGEGRISSYAWGAADYHDVLHDRLHLLSDFLRQLQPGCQVRGVVDTAPLLEREFAQLAGLGWIGKNTLLLNRELGSWFFLAALLTDVTLDYDRPHATDHCGTCRACLDACPTAAFPQPYVLDASRCLSYLTIELRDAVPSEHREALSEWLFGCDICQEVCPWNHRTPPATESAFAPREGQNPIELISLFSLSHDDFRRRFRQTPLWRAKREGILRNAALLLGTQRFLPATECLVSGLSDESPLIRSACAWALGKLATEPAVTALRRRSTVEREPSVRGEIEAALRRASHC